MSGDIFLVVCTLGDVRAEWGVGLASMHQVTGRTRHLSLIKHMGIADARNFAVNVACSAVASSASSWMNMLPCPAFCVKSAAMPSTLPSSIRRSPAQSRAGRPRRATAPPP